jgi:hypothetical protein
MRRRGMGAIETDVKKVDGGSREGKYFSPLKLNDLFFPLLILY